MYESVYIYVYKTIICRKKMKERESDRMNGREKQDCIPDDRELGRSDGVLLGYCKGLRDRYRIVVVNTE